MNRMIGIDVSKARLDVYGLEGGRRLAVGNDAAGVIALVDRLGLGAADVIVMEASGGYERLPHRLLNERRVGVAVVNAARVRATLPGRAAAWPRPTGSMPR
jgi:transposase